MIEATRSARRGVLGGALIAAAVLSAGPLPAQEPPGRGEKATLRVAADRTAYEPGETVRITAVLVVEPGWHVNSREPTFDYLIPTTVDLTLPAGFDAARVEYPPGEMKTFAFSAGQAISVYDGEVIVGADFDIPPGWPDGPAPVTVSARYQACSDRVCLPPITTEVGLEIAIGPGGVPTTRASGAGGTPEASLALMLALAVLGGLILNAMPCVLPVLSLKMLALVKGAEHGRGALVTGALETAAGIVLSFWALALAAVLARAGGMAVGWGVQFQQPIFVAALAVIVVLFCLNLWGLFEIVLPRPLADLAAWSPHGGVGSHLSAGFLATLMATPCSAPFLGTAVGFALTQTPATIFAVFTALGLGMALPYLLVAAVPGSERLLPRPGAWMVHLRVVLGFGLAAAAVWLLYVLDAQLGGARVAFIELSLLALAASVWARHVTRRAGARRAALAGALASAALVVGLAGGGAVPAASARAAALADPAALIDWVAFDRARAESLARSGVPVFVDVTADWCFTCKVNEALVLETEAVSEAFRRAGVVAMRADWTNRDDAIGRFLADHGRSGLPFYLLYAPGGSTHVFGEIITRNEIVNAVRDASAPGTR